MLLFIILCYSIHTLYTKIYGNNVSNSNIPLLYTSTTDFISSNKPYPRELFSFFINSQKTYYYLFGGYGYNQVGKGSMNDLWIFRVDDGLWKYTGKGHLDNLFCNDEILEGNKLNYFHENNIPNCGYGVCTVQYDDGKFILFGGTIHNEGDGWYSNSLWEFDADNGTFAKINHDREELISNNSISANPNIFYNSLAATKVWITSCDLIESNRILYFGGKKKYDFYNQVFEYDIITDSFSWRRGSNESNDEGVIGDVGEYSDDFDPCARAGHSSWYMKGLLYIFSGGVKKSPYSINDLLAYNKSINQWCYLKGTSNSGYYLSVSENKYHFHENNIPGGNGGIWYGIEDYVYINRPVLRPAYENLYFTAEVWVYSISRNQFKFINGSLNAHTNTSFINDNEILGGRGGMLTYKLSNYEVLMGFGMTYLQESRNIELYYSDLWIMNFRDTITECNGGGEESLFYCKCHEGFYGEECQYFNCTGVLKNTNGSCFNHGECIDPNTCVCDFNYQNLSDCSEWFCYNKSNIRNPESNCNSHGDCIEHDSCNCYKNYDTLEDCSEWFCYNISNLLNNDGNMCSNHGSCEGYNECDCLPNYNTSKDCSKWFCYGISNTITSTVCSGKGNCSSHERCDCEVGWKYASNCSIYTCNFIPHYDSNVCHGKGDCIDVDNCNCTYPHQYGYYCEENILNEAVFEAHVLHVKWNILEESLLNSIKSTEFNCSYLIVSPNDIFEETVCNWDFGSDILTTNELLIKDIYSSGIFENGQIITVHSITKRSHEIKIKIIVPIINNELDYTDFIIYGSVVIGLFLFLVAIVFLICCIVNTKDRKKMKKFRQIKDIDVILEEQRLEDSNSVNISINQSYYIIDSKDIKLISEIGRGGSGSTVYKAYWNKTVVSYKVFRGNSFDTQKNYDEFEKEVSLLCNLRHPHLLTFFGMTVVPPRIGFVTELCENGNLEEFVNLHTSRGDFIQFSKKIKILFEIAEAMKFLHSKNVIHRDLKCENVMFSKDWKSKLIDFGLSKIIVDENRERFTSYVGTSFYIAPEVVLGKYQYDYKVDVFSYSMIMAVLIRENTLLFDIADRSIEMKIALSPSFRPEISDDLINDENLWYKELMIQCWNSSPAIRPSFSEIAKILQSHKIDESEELTNVKDIGEELIHALQIIKEKDRELVEKDKEITKLKNEILELKNK